MIRLNVVGLLATFTILANIVNAGNYMWDSSCKPTGKDGKVPLLLIAYCKTSNAHTVQMIRR